jgi:putative sigma-54 modulation protein
MHIVWQARNAEITQRFRSYAEPRLQTLARHFGRIASVTVVLSAQRNWRRVEITVEANGALLRAEESSDDELTSFDRAMDAIEKQIERYKSRRRIRQSPRSQPAAVAASESAEEQGEANPALHIVRTKRVPLKPMTPQEAALQMELLGHDFFLYLDADTEQVAVVYRRHAGGYGVLMPE